MANPYPAQEELISEIESLIEDAAESVDEDELAERERKANEVVESARSRFASRKNLTTRFSCAGEIAGFHALA